MSRSNSTDQLSVTGRLADLGLLSQTTSTTTDTANSGNELIAVDYSEAEKRIIASFHQMAESARFAADSFRTIDFGFHNLLPEDVPTKPKRRYQWLQSQPIRSAKNAR